MRQRKSLLESKDVAPRIVLLLCLILLLPPFLVSEAQGQVDEPVDLLVLVDASASMGQLDKSNLAASVVQSILETAQQEAAKQPQSRVGVYCFSSVGRTLNLVPLFKLTPLAECAA